MFAIATLNCGICLFNWFNSAWLMEFKVESLLGVRFMYHLLSFSCTCQKIWPKLALAEECLTGPRDWRVQSCLRHQLWPSPGLTQSRRSPGSFSSSRQALLCMALLSGSPQWWQNLAASPNRSACERGSSGSSHTSPWSDADVDQPWLQSSAVAQGGHLVWFCKWVPFRCGISGNRHTVLVPKPEA